jgi:glycosyltransferase involved in cell wall biosynthesis
MARLDDESQLRRERGQSCDKSFDADVRPYAAFRLELPAVVRERRERRPVRRRVLQVITPSHFSGAEMQLARLTLRMQDRGHEMPVLVKRGSSALAEMRRRELPVEAARIGGKANVLAPWLIAAAARQHRSELVHSVLSSASYWSGWLESLGGPPSVGHVQGFTSACWHRRQSLLIAVSGAVRDDLVAQGIPAERITVLHNAADPGDLRIERSPAAVRAEFGAAPDDPIVGTIAHLSVKKGYRELFAAIPQVLRQFPRCQFWVVGRGDLQTELETTARAGGFLHAVRFTGFRKDAPDLLSAMDVFALPSHREPCALTYVEAALLGKPIIACRAGGAPESIADGDTGILAPVGDAPAIGEALCRLLDNRDAARSMGQRGRQRALELFSWGRYLDSLEQVYERLLATSERRAAA